MNKGKLLSAVLFVLGLACFGMYFVVGSKPSEYKVLFDSKGGSTVSEQIIKVGEKVSVPDEPTKESADFVEWQLDGTKYDFNSPVEKDLSLVAKWNEFKEYNVEVTLEDKTYTVKVREGKEVTLDSLNIPSKDGFNTKLYTEAGEEYDLTTKVSTDLKLIAKYVEIKKFTVAFNSNGGSKVASVKVEEGKNAIQPDVSRDGYDLDGWYLGDTKYDFNTPVTKDITLKAKWIEKGKVNVIFMADDKVYKTIPVKENTKVSKPSNPTKKGNKFVEWQLNGTKFDFNTKITAETTLTAKFEEVDTYTVSFNSDGGSKVATQEVEVGKKATKPTDPTKKGYVFKEWQLNGKTYDFDKEVVEDLALKATWEVEKTKYTVKFVDNDGKEISKSQSVEEGQAVAKPDNPTKTGKIFEEWLLNNQTYDFKTPVTSDITLTARFRDQKKYIVLFKSDGGSPIPGMTEVMEGDKLIRPSTNPTWDGHKFLGWNLDGKKYDFNSKVTKDITLIANWEKIEAEQNTPDVNSNTEEGK